MPRQIKILFDPQIFCAQVYGGVSRYFCELASRLPAVDSNFLIKIIAPLYVNEYISLVPKSLVRGFPAPKFIFRGYGHMTSFVRSGFRLFGIGLGAIYIHFVNPDIIHETYFYPINPFHRRAKKVLTIYDMIHEKFPSDFPSNDKTAKYKKLAALSADHIICISESTRRDVIDILGVESHKTSVVYLGFSFFTPLKNTPNDAAHFFTRPYLLYVGKRDGYKNFEQFIRAYVNSNALTEAFRIICFGGGAFTSNEIKIMSDLGISRDSVLQISGDDQLLGYFYKNAAAFVYPSLYEGFGIPPLEAMSQCCPVVCSFSSSIPEVVGDAGEYFDPNDVVGICEAIERVVFNKARTKELQLLGGKQLTKFSWDKCAQETRKVYLNLFEISRTNQ
jgi:glycosyltransferase involved in cell wall biosynthesis